jgi:hypothetical protein
MLHVLSLLVALMDQYEKQVEEACPSDIDFENPDRMFFELLAKSYNSFLMRTEHEPDDMQLEKDLSHAYRECTFVLCFGMALL